ncbi:cell cycle checkpoint protein [Aspergillus japonicus CBS 114.51]|uniref:Checkpoint protein n=2 Tax=Aspergillus TaxID=5052 RepID=A0A2V5HE76_ASPV1|nr:cell cycle checkpoint protein [Aspergillus japonicus CBS 114.51]PYI22648.1 cell cycle checkpoint protein [Aspergillus violaceofuscus CBS 115571]RAH76405.1 cell cycle checkpoint protein [Aspergillus japonicus CBS 114.51]
MRFRTKLTNAETFSKLTASLSSLGKTCWMRLEPGNIRFTIIPDQGTQVWAQLPIDAIFDESSYILESNSGGIINLEVPIGALHRALRSAVDAKSAQLRLTQKGRIPLLALTIRTLSWAPGSNALGITAAPAPAPAPAPGTGTGPGSGSSSNDPPTITNGPTHAPPSSTTTTTDTTTGPARPGRERETVITQEIPVKVFHESAVEGLHEPRCRDPDVHIILPSLGQLKSISERFTKLASPGHGFASAASDAATKPTATGASAAAPKLELSANMHGSLRLAIATDALRISSVWSGLVNPSLDPGQLSQGEMERLPSERMRAVPGDDEAGWARVRIDGRDWGKVLSVGRLSPRVVASFVHETALILYVYLPGTFNEEDSCLTYYINSYAA